MGGRGESPVGSTMLSISVVSSGTQREAFLWRVCSARNHRLAVDSLQDTLGPFSPPTLCLREGEKGSPGSAGSAPNVHNDCPEQERLLSTPEAAKGLLRGPLKATATPAGARGIFIRGVECLKDSASFIPHDIRLASLAGWEEI